MLEVVIGVCFVSVVVYVLSPLAEAAASRIEQGQVSNPKKKGKKVKKVLWGMPAFAKMAITAVIKWMLGLDN